MRKISFEGFALGACVVLLIFAITVYAIGSSTPKTLGSADSKDCSQKLDAFRERTAGIQDFYSQKAITNGYPERMVVRMDMSSFLVGFSPELKECVGGYSTTEDSFQVMSTGERSWITETSYFIQNLGTNELLSSYSPLSERISNPEIQKMDADPIPSDISVTVSANAAARAKWKAELSRLTAGRIGDD
ncbi:MAG: hypothetical protein QOE22_696 [Candidatus Parcubacteria bacterium]|jgi:hypothetical protein|nr:hypothetical protein [Candidatus Parcubacteria bacterium]